MKSNFRYEHVGYIAIYRGRIIGTGCNGEKTHPVQKTFNKYRGIDQPNYVSHKIHAEISCLSSIMHMNDINWNEVSVYGYRICKSREHGIARPCPACMALLKSIGIRHIYYTTDDGYAYTKLDH